MTDLRALLHPSSDWDASDEATDPTPSETQTPAPRTAPPRRRAAAGRTASSPGPAPAHPMTRTHPSYAGGRRAVGAADEADEAQEADDTPIGPVSAAPAVAPDRPDRTPPDRTAGDHSTPDRTAPDRTRPDRTRPDRSAPGGPAKGSAAPALAPRRYPLVDHPEVKAARHLRVVETRRRFAAARQRRARAIIVVASIAAICVAFGLVYLHVLSAQKQFELNRLTIREENAQSSYQQLRVGVETENSPARIMAAAKRLGMVAPTVIIPIPAVRGGTVTPTAPTAPAAGVTAPGGVADWSTHKSDLTGTP